LFDVVLTIGDKDLTDTIDYLDTAGDLLAGPIFGFNTGVILVFITTLSATLLICLFSKSTGSRQRTLRWIALLAELLVVGGVVGVITFAGRAILDSKLASLQRLAVDADTVFREKVGDSYKQYCLQATTEPKNGALTPATVAPPFCASIRDFVSVPATFERPYESSPTNTLRVSIKTSLDPGTETLKHFKINHPKFENDFRNLLMLARQHTDAAGAVARQRKEIDRITRSDSPMVVFVLAVLVCVGVGLKISRALLEARPPKSEHRD
jgi:hypothetical protein